MDEILAQLDGNPVVPLNKMNEVQIQQAAEVIALLSESTGKTVSLELRYGRAVENDTTLAVAQRDENTFLYQWTGCYWQVLTKYEGQKHAFEWLERHAQGKATSHLASQCYQTALLKGAALPSKPRQAVVPLKDCWVVVGEDGGLTVQAPDRSYGVTYQIEAELKAKVGTYEPAPLPTDSYFNRFLTTSLPDPEVRELVQQYCGYTLMNDTRFQKALVNCGFGSNGKSILLKVMQKLHKKTAAIRLDNMEKFGLASIADASLAVSSETPKRGINEQVLKACISSDPVVVELKGRNEFTVCPTAKWIICCNRFPHITDESDGVWRRLLIVNWTVQFDESNKIDRLEEIIIEKELHLVVNWCLAGLQRLLKQGDFIVPAAVRVNTENQKEGSNTVLAYTQDHFVGFGQPGQTMSKEKIFEKYLSYCEEQGHTPCGNAEFWSRIRAIFPGLVESKKRLNGIQKRHVNLAFNWVMPETSQEEIDQAFGQQENN
ncbi:hypothetical protein B0T49_21800 [Chromobacterium violaceum]|nr:hypothetical protein B0T49_21800 [Chromobacterium violaceum]OQS45778.1 hypothetical protein B0T48_17980 [Chromobacterium violaceum]